MQPTRTSVRPAPHRASTIQETHHPRKKRSSPAVAATPATIAVAQARWTNPRSPSSPLNPQSTTSRKPSPRKPSAIRSRTLPPPTRPRGLNRYCNSGDDWLNYSSGSDSKEESDSGSSYSEPSVAASPPPQTPRNVFSSFEFAPFSLDNVQPTTSSSPRVRAADHRGYEQSRDNGSTLPPISFDRDDDGLDGLAHLYSWAAFSAYTDGHESSQTPDYLGGASFLATPSSHPDSAPEPRSPTDEKKHALLLTLAGKRTTKSPPETPPEKKKPIIRPGPPPKPHERGRSQGEKRKGFLPVSVARLLRKVSADSLDKYFGQSPLQGPGSESKDETGAGAEEGKGGDSESIPSCLLMDLRVAVTGCCADWFFISDVGDCLASAEEKTSSWKRRFRS